MPDISMCNNGECWQRHTCYRYMAKPDPVMQRWVTLPTPAGGESCGYWMRMEPGDELREAPYRKAPAPALPVDLPSTS